MFTVTIETLSCVHVRQLSTPSLAPFLSFWHTDGVPRFFYFRVIPEGAR